MRKRIGLVGVVVLVCILIFGIAPTQASLSLGPGYYAPNFGEVNSRHLEGFTKKFEAGLTYGLALGFDISPSFGVRGECNFFASETSEEAIYIEGWQWFPIHLKKELIVIPLLLSGIYRISPAPPLCLYIGAGICFFYTKMETIYLEETLPFTPPYIVDVDYSMGYHALVGLEIGGRSVSLTIEARYIVAEAEMKYFQTTVDLEGLFGGLMLNIKF